MEREKENRQKKEGTHKEHQIMEMKGEEKEKKKNMVGQINV